MSDGDPGRDTHFLRREEQEWIQKSFGSTKSSMRSRNPRKPAIPEPEIPSSNLDSVDPTSPIADNIEWKGDSRVITLVVTLSLSGAGTPC